MKRGIPRRDRVYIVGNRAMRVTGSQAEKAWLDLAIQLQEMGTMDMPKFKHLLAAIRRATIAGRK